MDRRDSDTLHRVFLTNFTLKPPPRVGVRHDGAVACAGHLEEEILMRPQAFGLEKFENVIDTQGLLTITRPAVMNDKCPVHVTSGLLSFTLKGESGTRSSKF